MKFSSLAALEVVKMTTSSAANDKNFIKITTFPFQCCTSPQNRMKYVLSVKSWPIIRHLRRLTLPSHGSTYRPQPSMEYDT